MCWFFRFACVSKSYRLSDELLFLATSNLAQARRSHLSENSHKPVVLTVQALSHVRMPSLSARLLPLKRKLLVWARMVHVRAFVLFSSLIWLFVSMIEWFTLKHEVWCLVCFMWYNETEILLFLVWNESRIGWLIVYWNEIMMFWDNMWILCEKHRYGMS